MLDLLTTINKRAFPNKAAPSFFGGRGWTKYQQQQLYGGRLLQALMLDHGSTASTEAKNCHMLKWTISGLAHFCVFLFKKELITSKRCWKLRYQGNNVLSLAHCLEITSGKCESTAKEEAFLGMTKSFYFFHLMPLLLYQPK